MRIRPFAELATAHEATRRFTSLGLASSGLLTPEACAEFQQRAVAAAELVESVPDGTRQSFERLREFQAYGVLCYNLFTTIGDLTWVVLEQALRERFVAYYHHSVPLVDRQGNVTRIAADSFDKVTDALRPGGTHSRGWHLEVDSTTRSSVPLTLAPLLRWARHVGLLGGQRNRRLQIAVYPALRNNFAHGAGYRVGTPVQSARAIHDLAEIVNRLWGHRTPGGRLYPAPLDRELVVLGWSAGWAAGEAGGEYAEMTPEQLEGHRGDGWTYLIVLAVPSDSSLVDFDSRYELTTYPTDLLWGPGRRSEALAWLADHPSRFSESADYLDRLFAVRSNRGVVEWPRRPAMLLSMPQDERVGEWWVLRADYPADALGHVRHLVANEECPSPRYGGCAIEEVARGNSAEVIATICRLRPDIVAYRCSTGGVPHRFRLPADVGQ